MERLYTTVLAVYFIDKDLLKVSITKFMNYILDQANSIKDLIDKKKINNTSYRKYNLLSGHDSTILSMLIASGNYQSDCLIKAFESNPNNPDFTDDCPRYPPLASSFAFEIFTTDETDPKLRFNFNGVYFDLCA